VEVATAERGARAIHGSRHSRLVLLAGVVAGALATADALSAQVRLADASDRAAFRSWFVLLADAQFERASPEVTDCAALIRFAFREALRTHDGEWRRRMTLPAAPMFPDVQSGPRPTAAGWPLFLTARSPQPVYAQFADARTLVSLNTRPLGRRTTALQPGDLLYFHQPGQAQPDHLMVFVGRSYFDPEGQDWVVYHTGPLDEGAGEVRKVRLQDLARHPSARWRPVPDNPNFVGTFRLAVL
jgi:uncharacterized protein YfaT (DUF1175 family)